jgi:hypothetical protein
MSSTKVIRLVKDQAIEFKCLYLDRAFFIRCDLVPAGEEHPVPHAGDSAREEEGDTRTHQGQEEPHNALHDEELSQLCPSCYEAMKANGMILPSRPRRNR